MNKPDCRKGRDRHDRWALSASKLEHAGKIERNRVKSGASVLGQSCRIRFLSLSVCGQNWIACEAYSDRRTCTDKCSAVHV